MIKRRKRTQDTFYDRFAAGGTNLLTTAELLQKLVEAPFEDRARIRGEIHDAENRGDEITHSIASALSATFVTPLDRDDIANLASSLDDCLDFIDEAADLIVLYQLGELHEKLTEQVNVIHQCAKLTADAMKRLATLDKLKHYTVEINRLENEGDKLYRKMLAWLFNESNKDAVEIIKIKDVIEALERGVDSFETLANGVETIYIKES
ncbi:MAG: DUF47 family protein [Varibaculum sp.]|nr:DUF47 family protein [Varibaculum sp.]